MGSRGCHLILYFMKILNLWYLTIQPFVNDYYKAVSYQALDLLHFFVFSKQLLCLPYFCQKINLFTYCQGCQQYLGIFYIFFFTFPVNGNRQGWALCVRSQRSSVSSDSLCGLSISECKCLSYPSLRRFDWAFRACPGDPI